MKQALLVFILMLCLPQYGYGDKITIVADEWPPFNNAEDSETKGYMIDIAQEIFESEGHTFVYKNFPWKRALHEVQNGTCTGVVGASKSDAAGFIFPSEELAQNYIAFYVKKGNQWKFKGHGSISSISLAVIAGYDYREWLNKYIKEHADNHVKIQINFGDNPLARNLKKLMAGRVDAVVDNESAIRHVAKQLGLLKKIKCAGYGNQVSYIYIAFSPNLPKSETYAQILSRGIVGMRQSGRLKEILSSYGLLDWKK